MPHNSLCCSSTSCLLGYSPVDVCFHRGLYIYMSIAFPFVIINYTKPIKKRHSNTLFENQNEEEALQQLSGCEETIHGFVLQPCLPPK